MVVGVSLDNAKRPGWEAAYLDYANLKLFLEELDKCSITLQELKKQEEMMKNQKQNGIDLNMNGSMDFSEQHYQGGGNNNNLDRHRNHILDEHTSLLSESGLGGCYTEDDDEEEGVARNRQIGENQNNNDKDPKESLPPPSQEELEFRSRDLSQKFLTMLRREVERISLFATSRKGELADATGSLRFNAFLDNDETRGYDTGEGGPVVMSISPQRSKFLTVRHDSVNVGGSGASSSTKPKYRSSLLLMNDDEIGDEEYGLYQKRQSTNVDPTLDNYNDDINDNDDDDLADELSFLLPQMASQMHTNNSMSNSSLRFRESLENNPRPMFTGAAVLKMKEYHNARVSVEKEVEEEEEEGMDMKVEEGWEEKFITKKENESSNLDPYTLVAVELLHLLRFICVNAMGVRKILKQYDEIMEKQPLRPGSHSSLLRRELDKMRPFLSSFSTNNSDAKTGADMHLQQLTNSDTIAAITSSLLKASLKTGSMDIKNVEKFLIHDEALLRFKCAVDCIDILREYATTAVCSPFSSYLSRRAMTVAGYKLGGMEGKMQRALEVLLTLDPDVILKMDKLDLAEWQQRCWNYTFTDAGDKMRHTSFDFLKEDDDYYDESSSDSDSWWGGVDHISMCINLMSIFLYSMNYYVIAPTANTYAMYLGFKGAYGSVLIGASSASACLAAFIYSLWYNVLPIKSALLFSSLCPILGNIAYSFAMNRESMKMALLGRILVGFGSAEVVNRQLIASCVHFNHITRASVNFVLASSAGIAAGPLIGALLDTFAGRDFFVNFDLPYLGGVILDNSSSPGFLMAALWFIEFTLVLFLFSEPFRINSSHQNTYTRDETKTKRVSFLSELKLVLELIYRTPTLPLTLLLSSYVEMICEVVISSCGMISRQFFGWDSSMVGFFIALLGISVLPVHYVTERASRVFNEGGLMKFSVIFITLSLFSIINYEKLGYDIKVLSVKSWEEAQTDGKYVRDSSVATYNNVENATVHDWDLLKDPQTWKDFRNETEKELGRLENATEVEWERLSENAAYQWKQFTNLTEEKWSSLSSEANEKFKNFSNTSEHEWGELSNETQSRWKNLVNESNIEWSKLSHSASDEWKKLPNQTTEGLHQMNDEWNRLPNQTQSGWGKLINGTKKEWGLLRNETSVMLDKRNKTSTGKPDGDGDLGQRRSKQSDEKNGSIPIDDDGNSRRKVQSVLLLPYDWGYGHYAYIIGIFLVFISTIMLDGISTSTMCKAAPSKLNNTSLKMGLLATVLGALGRVAGDVIIAFFALIDRFDYLDFANRTFLPLIPITLYACHLVFKHYSHPP